MENKTLEKTKAKKSKAKSPVLSKKTSKSLISEKNKKENTYNYSGIDNKIFEFQKVEDFFEDNGQYQNYREWNKLGKVESYELQEKHNRLVLTFNTPENTKCLWIIRFCSPYTFRVRFNPGYSKIEDFPQVNSRSIVQDTFDETCELFEDVEITASEKNKILEVIAKSKLTNKITMKLKIKLSQYNLSVYKYNNKKFTKVHGDAKTAVYYKKRTSYSVNGKQTSEYSIIQAKEMPTAARYIGFGEKGGTELYKNGARLTYLNFDNMRYMQIYKNGPLDVREPLYDSNPFFMEFVYTPKVNNIYGVFIDNMSATYFDLGSYNHNKEYLFGSLYGDLDYYFFLGETGLDVMTSFYNLVGKSRLKPRYMLGYHQGCYGYENEYLLQDAVNGYRGNEIPLDGLHVDVDVQRNYGTFTMDESKFSPETFENLRKRGIKCSTNITPVVSYTNKNYKTYESGNRINAFVSAATIRNQQAKGYYNGGVYYGGQRGTFGNYPDFGRKDVRYWWGQQYRLLYERGLEMVWQDMTCPSIPDPNENRDVEIYSEKDNAYFKIGDRISSSMRSIFYENLLSDNSLKKYDGFGNMRIMHNNHIKAPAARIRNVYAYNLHKATYHGLNYIWMLVNYTFTSLGENGISLEDAESVIDSLESKKIIHVVFKDNKVYEVMDGVNLDDPNIDLGLTASMKQYKEEVIYILKQSVTLKKKRYNKRNFIIGRGGFAGMHRFAGLWTGDNSSSWDFFKINISQVLSLGLTGQGISGQDIGGFEREHEWEHWADPELLTRWTCAGAFLPWFRNHYINKGQKWFQEPYKYQDYKHMAPEKDQHLYDSVLPICKYYIQLRYRLLQLFYDCLFENTLSGTPLTRPLFVNETGDHALMNEKAEFLNNEFFVGKDLLIAPILDKEEWGKHGKREVYLPTGSRWYSFKNNTQPLSEPQNGGTTFTYDAHLSANPEHIPFTTPIYIREGSIIPTVELEQYVGQLKDEGKVNPITLNVYPGNSGKYEMFEDDGESRSSAPAGNSDLGADPLAQGEYRKTIITHSESNSDKTITLKWVHNNYCPDAEYFFLAILHEPSLSPDPIKKIDCKSINIGSKSSQLKIKKITTDNTDDNAAALWESTNNAWYYNPGIHISFVKIFLPHELAKINKNQKSEADNTFENNAPGLSIKIKY